MKKCTLFVLLNIAFCFLVRLSFAQDSLQNAMQSQLLELKNQVEKLEPVRPGNTNFMLRGFGHTGLNSSTDEVTFTAGSFNPIFLWKQGDHWLFEGELELEFEGNELAIGLGYANVSYIVTKGLVIRAGKFLVPFGTFRERLHPAWINRMSTVPLGFGHGGLGPTSDVGVEVRGGLQAGRSKFNYAFYVVNGPVLNDGTMDPEEAGMIHFENMTDNNKGKAFGGRIGFLPFLNSSLELGVSGYFAKPGARESPFTGNPALNDITYKDVNVNLAAFDLSYVKLVSGIKGILDIKSQYNSSKVSSATYYNSGDATRYTFDNSSNGFYGQVSYRPALMSNEVVKNFELVGRYSNYETPDGALWGSSKQDQWAIGLNYWLTWRTVFKTSYQSTDIDKEGIKSTNDGFFLHIAFGF